MNFLKSKKFKVGRRSFTLVELLIAIGIVAVLSTIILITLNPIELFREARDSKRIAELASLDRAIKFYQTEKGCSNIGSPERLYISLPDTSPKCSNLTLPALPPDWEYRCVDQGSTAKADGNGWIPINFAQLAAGSLSSLPLDPLNNYDPANFINNHFYEYAVSGCDYELNAKTESKKYGLGGN